MTSNVSLDSSIKNLQLCKKAIKHSHYVTDLQIATTEQGQKVIQLRSYAAVPFFGRIISYLRAWFCDSKPLAQEIEAIKKSHDQALGELLDQLMEGKGQDDDKTIANINQYSLKLYKFGEKINAKCSLVLSTETLVSGLSTRCNKLCNPDALDKLYEESKAGKVVDPTEFAKLQRLDALVTKVTNVVKKDRWYAKVHTLGLIIHQQEALQSIEQKLATFPFLAQSPNKLYELCQRINASPKIEFSGEGKVGPLEDGEMQQLQAIVQKLRNINGFKMYFYDLHAPLEKLANALREELRYQEIEFKLSSLECLKDEPRKASKIKEILSQSLVDPTPRLWSKGPLSQKDREAMPGILEFLHDKAEIVKQRIEQFKVTANAEQKLAELKDFKNAPDKLLELKKRIDEFKKSHPQIRKEILSLYTANDAFKKYKETHPDAKFKDWIQANPAPVGPVPALKTMAQLRKALECVLADKNFAIHYPKLSREWGDFLKHISLNFRDLSDKDKSYILSYVPHQQLLQIGKVNRNLRNKAEELLCQQTSRIYTDTLKNICEQLAKIKGEHTGAVCEKLEDMIEAALNWPTLTNIDQVLSYLTQERQTLSIALSPLSPEQIKAVKLPCIDAFINSVANPPTSSLQENNCECHVHQGLADSVALSVFSQLKRSDPQTIDWNNLPGQYTLANLIKALAKFDLHRALEILTLAPVETPEQRQHFSDAWDNFYAIYRKIYKKEKDKEFLSHLPQSKEKDKLVYLSVICAEKRSGGRFDDKSPKMTALVAVVKKIKDTDLRQKALASLYTGFYIYNPQARFLDMIEELDDPIKSLTLQKIVKECDFSSRDQEIDVALRISNPEIKDETLMLSILPKCREPKQHFLILGNISDREKYSRALLDFIDDKFDSLPDPELFLDYFGDENLKTTAKNTIKARKAATK